MAKSVLAGVPPETLPAHIGIIMDGNGRWAAQRGLPRNVGHKQGADVFGKIAEHCRSLGIKHLTTYAFSTENWKRPASEIDAIMDLFRKYLTETFKHKGENVRLRFLGDLTPLADDIRRMIDDAERESEKNSGINVNIALNYGGRDEIVRAARLLAEKCASGEITPTQITEQALSDSMYTAGQPDPDLIIRPSGEFRTSNFLLWQSAYTELVFMDVLWPDFTPAHLEKAIASYLSRSRRFGGI